MTIFNTKSFHKWLILCYNYLKKKTIDIQWRKRISKHKKLILIIGPESTATRALTEDLCDHADVLGTENPSTHEDILDDVWSDLVAGHMNVATNKLIELASVNKTIITRRSVPHATRKSFPAKTRSFPPVEKLLIACRKAGIEPFLLITSRSPIPNLFSWAAERDSAKNSMTTAYVQYRTSYLQIVNLCSLYDVDFFIISLESYVSDGRNLIDSIHKYLGLSIESPEVNREYGINPNIKHYAKYFE